MPELRQFKLPDVGEGLTEADIVRWHVQPGDPVKINQIIVEIETAKAVVELPSPYAGTVAELLVPEGVTVDVGVPIIAISTGATTAPASKEPPFSSETGGAAGSPPPASPVAEAPVAGAPVAGAPDAEAVRVAATALDLIPPLPAEPEPEERQAVLVGYGVKVSSKARRPRKTVPMEPAPGGTRRAGGATLAKPPVRKLARDLGVDLDSVAGTGPDGSITRDDVQAATTVAPPAVGALMTPVAREERIPVRGVRKHTAAAMTESAFTAPHVTMFLQIDMTETMTATERLKALPDFAGSRVSPLLLVARALLVAVARHPMINSTWDEAAQEIVVRHYVNLGIAAATERGLVVPNVKDAHAMSLPELASALTELAERARAGKSTPAELAGGTVSITNVGVFGVDTGTPILPPGEAAILALGQVKDAPWVHEGQLAVRKVCTLGMSFDHRIVDGDLGAAVLRDVGAMLTDPVRMLAWS
jgi:2-oxoisovalerate dehydrogenase E2 component (dihydrolipoyl transacylase)